jgi:hypothetical protein
VAAPCMDEIAAILRFMPPDALRKRAWPYVLLVAAVFTVFWKLVLTTEYTFLDNPDLANQALPWLEAQVTSLRRGSVLLWTPYEWFGQPLIGQVLPGVASPFTWLLALAPLDHGYLQLSWVHLWYVLIHCAAAVFAYLLARDLGCAKGPSVLGGVLYATAGYCGNTEWPSVLAPGIWAPLVFRFLLRSLRGRAPVKNAAWAGTALGMAWLCGHHEPATMLTLAAAAACAVTLASGPHRRQALLRSGVMFAAMALVSAVQVMPAVEYGRLAKRWTVSGALTWKDKVPVAEHEKGGLSPADLRYIVIPGGNALRTDPFAGTVGLSLAAVALWGAFRRREVRLFALLAAGALLYAMARNDVLYGPLYTLLPAVEKSRSPVMALSVFHLSVAALAALGADVLRASPEAALRSGTVRVLAWFGGGLTALYLLHDLAPAIPWNADTRPAMSGFLALLLAAIYSAWARGYAGRGPALTVLGLLLVVEQGNEVGWNWTRAPDLWQAGFLKPLAESRDVGDFVRGLPGPKRIHVNDNDVKFTFGDWYRVDGGHAFTVSMLVNTNELNWWQERLIRMYGINYEVSKAPTRPGQEEVFHGASGLKVFRNPDAFPRAWTVHQVTTVASESAARDLVRDGPIDLRTTAVTEAPPPRLEQCGGADRVEAADVRPASVRANVEMACRGLLIVSDSFYPGWSTEVDGRAAPILRVNTAIRGVVVDEGRHQVLMRYRPLTVYAGLACTLLGLLAALFLGRRGEADAVDTGTRDGVAERT